VKAFDVTETTRSINWPFMRPLRRCREAKARLERVRKPTSRFNEATTKVFRGKAAVPRLQRVDTVGLKSHD